MKNYAIVAMAFAVGQAHKVNFIDDTDGISLAAIQLNPQELIQKPQSKESNVLETTNHVIKRQDPEVLQKMSKYNWEDVPPHSNAFYICNNKLKVTREVAEPGFPPSADRKLPERYQGQTGDNFMGEIISKYAMEGGKAQGKPNGEFWFEWDGAEKASAQVLQDYVHIDSEDAQSIICDKFKATWEHYDVNNSGKVEAERMPGFFQHLIGNNFHMNFQ